MPIGEAPHKVPEHGYGMGYQESVDIETRCLMGMKPDEFYRRQVGLVLDTIPPSISGSPETLSPRKIDPGTKFPDGATLQEKARHAKMKLVDHFNLGLKTGDRVLDLAVGEGDTSRYLATTGASIEARDIESYLIERGRQKDAEVRETNNEITALQGGVRKATGITLGNINYAQGDYSKIKKSVDKTTKFDAITCLSRSFIYLGERAKYVKALKDLNDLLVPGGKVVLQSRQKIKDSSLPWKNETNTSLETTPEGFIAMKDNTTGTKFVWRLDSSLTTLPDGIKQHTGSRYIQYKDGTIKELGQVTSDDHLDFANLRDMGSILKEAGYTNLQLKVENLSSDGSEIMYAIVAEKPQGQRVRASIKSIVDKIKNLLPLAR